MLLAVACVVVGCSAGVKVERSKVRHRGQLIFNGYENEKVDCYFCHSGNGRGAKMYCYNCHSGEGEENDTVPDLAPKVARMSDKQLLEVIAHGKAFMPGFKGKMTAEQTRHVLCWLRLAFGGPVEPARTGCEPKRDR